MLRCVLNSLHSSKIPSPVPCTVKAPLYFEQCVRLSMSLQDFLRADEEETLVDEEKQLSIQLYVAQLQAIEDAKTYTREELKETEILLTNIGKLQEMCTLFCEFDESDLPEASAIAQESLPLRWAAAAAADGCKEWASQTPPSELLNTSTGFCQVYHRIGSPCGLGYSA